MQEVDARAEHVALLVDASTRVPVTGPEAVAGDVRTYLIGSPRFDSAADVAVVEAGRLVGMARIEDVLAADAAEPIGELMDRDPPVVAPEMDREAAAWKAVDHGQGALAVVGSDGEFLGLVPPWRLLGVLLSEHDEDLARLSGYLSETEEARSAMTEPVARRFWHRLPWLLLGLFAALLAAAIVGRFEASLEAEVALAFFIPGVVYMADAVGTQTEALIVRGMSVGVPVGGVAGREGATGTLIGLVLAILVYPAALVWVGQGVALTVAATIWAACTVATSVGMGLPWLLRALGQDPAFGSGPLATVIQDLLTLLIYFGFALVFL